MKMKDNRNELPQSLNKTMRFYNHRGRLIQGVWDGYIMNGKHYPNLHELNRAIDISLKNLSGSIK